MATDPGPPFEIVEHREPDGLHLVVGGELDLRTCETFLATIHGRLQQPGQTLVLDLAGVGFCDSYGIAALVEVRAAALRAGWAFRVHQLSPVTRRLIDQVGLTHFLEVSDAPERSAGEAS